MNGLTEIFSSSIISHSIKAKLSCFILWGHGNATLPVQPLLQKAKDEANLPLPSQEEIIPRRFNSFRASITCCSISVAASGQSRKLATPYKILTAAYTPKAKMAHTGAQSINTSTSGPPSAGLDDTAMLQMAMNPTAYCCCVCNKKMRRGRGQRKGKRNYVTHTQALDARHKRRTT
eukprot:scaffold2203_cov176-Amphora_coffeaeformis.AAC.3